MITKADNSVKEDDDDDLDDDTEDNKDVTKTMCGLCDGLTLVFITIIKLTFHLWVTKPINKI